MDSWSRQYYDNGLGAGSPKVQRGFHHSAGRQHLVPVLHWGFRKHLRLTLAAWHRLRSRVSPIACTYMFLTYMFRDAHADQSSSFGNGALPGG
jgi:hypothetical protein